MLHPGKGILSVARGKKAVLPSGFTDGTDANAWTCAEFVGNFVKLNFAIYPSNRQMCGSNPKVCMAFEWIVILTSHFEF